MYITSPFAKNKIMLDIKSKIVLKILTRECPNGSYNIVESKDIISAMPLKYRVDYDGLDNILIYLERQEFISIKYDDDGVYCLCVLPYGNEIIEMEGRQRKDRPRETGLWQMAIITFFSALASSLIALLLAYFIF